MSVGCVRHSYEPSVSECRDCHLDYCSQCLIWPFGESEPPLCRDCALVAVGVRGSHQRPTLVARGEEPAKPKRAARHHRPHAEMYIQPPSPLRRLGARLLDSIIPGILVLFVLWLFDSSAVTSSIDQTTGLEATRFNWAVVGGAWATTIFYETLLVWLIGGTLGKLVLGTRVVDPATGDRLGLGRAFLRAAALSISMSIGLLWLVSGLMVVVTKDRRTIHDYIAGSIVTFDID